MLEIQQLKHSPQIRPQTSAAEPTYSALEEFKAIFDICLDERKSKRSPRATDNP